MVRISGSKMSIYSDKDEKDKIKNQEIARQNRNALRNQSAALMKKMQSKRLSYGPNVLAAQLERLRHQPPSNDLIYSKTNPKKNQ